MPNEFPIVHVSAGDPTGLPIAIGVPFTKRHVSDCASISLVGPNGQPTPVSARPLVKWPDGSVRWALLTFAATEKGDHTVSVGAAKSAPPAGVRLSRAGDQLTLDNGQVRIVLAATGPSPICQLTALGHDYLTRPDAFRLLNDGFSSTHETRRTFRVLEESPHRARVRVEGAHFNRHGQRRLSYRLDVELWANWPSVRLDYHFFNLEPGQDELPINRMAAEFDFNLGPATHRHFFQSVHSLAYVPREVHNPGRVAIVADPTRGPAHVEDPAMLLDTDEYNFHVRPPLVDTAEWLGISDGTRSVYFQMQDFAAMRPKRVVSENASLQLEVWPSTAGPLALPQGRSRRQVMLLTFADTPTLSCPEIARRLTAPLPEGRATVSHAWLAHTGEFEQDRIFERASNIRFEKYLGRLMHLKTPQSWFDLGDTPDASYLRTYAPLGLEAQPLKKGAPPMDRVFLAGSQTMLADWSYPERFEPVWTNNEYDIISALVTEIMRTGRHDMWTYARWFARHTIEVDFIHYSDHKQQHRSTPQHSYNHNHSGSIPSHFWTQGLLQYYCLSGDPDALEIAEALGDKIVEDLTDPEMRKGFWGFTRELGWPCLSLAHLADITGKEPYRAKLAEIIDFFVGYDRRKFHGPINMSGADARYSLERQMIGSFFGYASMIEGVDHYQRKTGRKDVAVWLDQILGELRDALIAAHREGQTLWLNHMAPLAMAIGFERTGDARYLNAALVSLQECFDQSPWAHPNGEVKMTAMTYRALVRYLHHAHKAGLLQKLEYVGL